MKAVEAAVPAKKKLQTPTQKAVLLFDVYLFQSKSDCATKCPSLVVENEAMRAKKEEGKNQKEEEEK